MAALVTWLALPPPRWAGPALSLGSGPPLRGRGLGALRSLKGHRIHSPSSIGDGNWSKEGEGAGMASVSMMEEGSGEGRTMGTGGWEEEEGRGGGRKRKEEGMVDIQGQSWPNLIGAERADRL